MLGATQAANAIRLALRDAGLQPRTYAGTETVARVLGLRTNHPQGEGVSRARAREPATRAEVAYSLPVRSVSRPSRRTSCPSRATDSPSRRLDTVQTAVLRRARAVHRLPVRLGRHVRIATGARDGARARWLRLLGARLARVQNAAIPRARRCSGARSEGRTTFSRPRSVPLGATAARLGPAGDLLFFGTRGPASTPQEMGHMGIALAPGWFLHSSGNGVTLQPLRGWYVNRLPGRAVRSARPAWPRRRPASHCDAVRSRGHGPREGPR